MDFALSAQSTDSTQSILLILLQWILLMKLIGLLLLLLLLPFLLRLFLLLLLLLQAIQHAINVFRPKHFMMLVLYTPKFANSSASLFVKLDMPSIIELRLKNAPDGPLYLLKRRLMKLLRGSAS
jgi:hypothetical protein